MSMPLSSGSNVEMVTSVQRRRRWTLEEKIGWVRRAMEPGMMASLAAREAGVAPSTIGQAEEPSGKITRFIFAKTISQL